MQDLTIVAPPCSCIFYWSLKYLILNTILDTKYWILVKKYWKLLWIQFGHRHFARKGNNARLDNCGTPLQLDILLVTEIRDTGSNIEYLRRCTENCSGSSLGTVISHAKVIMQDLTIVAPPCSWIFYWPPKCQTTPICLVVTMKRGEQFSWVGVCDHLNHNSCFNMSTL